MVVILGPTTLFLKVATTADQLQFGQFAFALMVKVPASCPLTDTICPSVAALDVSLLQERVLGPLLGIGDARTDSRIEFVGGGKGTEELEQRVGSGEMAVAFALHPVTMRQLMIIADAGGIMPPKSTWFEPKLLSGLFVHMLQSSESGDAER